MRKSKCESPSSEGYDHIRIAVSAERSAVAAMVSADGRQTRSALIRLGDGIEAT